MSLLRMPAMESKPRPVVLRPCPNRDMRLLNFLIETDAHLALTKRDMDQIKPSDYAAKYFGFEVFYLQ
jgi:hypothetical protein